MDHLYSNCQRVPRLGLTPTSSPKVRPLWQPMPSSGDETETMSVLCLPVLLCCSIDNIPSPQGILSMGRVYYLWLFSAHTELHKDYVEVGMKSG